MDPEGLEPPPVGGTSVELLLLQQEEKEQWLSFLLKALEAGREQASGTGRSILASGVHVGKQ